MVVAHLPRQILLEYAKLISITKSSFVHVLYSLNKINYQVKCSLPYSIPIFPLNWQLSLQVRKLNAMVSIKEVRVTQAEFLILSVSSYQAVYLNYSIK